MYRCIVAVYFKYSSKKKVPEYSKVESPIFKGVGGLATRYCSGLIIHSTGPCLSGAGSRSLSNVRGLVSSFQKKFVCPWRGSIVPKGLFVHSGEGADGIAMKTEVLTNILLNYSIRLFPF